MSKKKIAVRIIAFIILTALLLEVLSVVSIRMLAASAGGTGSNPWNLRNEAKNSVDVVAIGSSDSYSSISPLEWWDSDGVTGYTWATASQKMGESYAYLKEIYKNQSPKLVFIEIGMLYSDKSDVKALEELVKGGAERVFPVFALHRFVTNIFNISRAIDGSFIDAKGYFLRDSVDAVNSRYLDYMDSEGKAASANGITRWTLEKCIKYCQKRGSEVVLLSVPSPKDWSQVKHDQVEEIASEMGVAYLDLNLELKGKINWALDSADGGIHLNTRGAMKVSRYLGRYLKKNYALPDHREDEMIAASWNKTAEIYKDAKDKFLSTIEDKKAD